jgi:hypothetical protein
MELNRMKLSAQTVRDNIAIMEECEEPDDAGYYLQLEHEKFVLGCIEKQIPKKPIIHGYREGREINTISFTCPNCNKHIGRENFCKHCGQALDWSDTE